MFKQKKQSLLGIDISASAVKVIELTRKGRGYNIESYATEPLPVGCVIEGRIDNIEKTASTVKRAVQASGSKVKNVATAIPISAAMKKVAALPKSLSERDMEDQVMYEAESFISRPLDEVMIGFDVIGPSAQDANNVDVLIVAGIVEVVNTYTTVLTQAGLKPVAVDVESYAIERSFSLVKRQLPNSGQDLNVALIDMGSIKTSLYILINGMVTFNYEQQFGSMELTENIEKHYGMSYEEADQAKKQIDNTPDDWESGVLAPFKASIVSTIKRGLQFFYSNAIEQQPVNHIILSGGCALINGISETVEEEINIPTSIANPLSSMTFGQNVKKSELKDGGPMLLSACGLAMREPN